MWISYYYNINVGPASDRQTRDRQTDKQIDNAHVRSLTVVLSNTLEIHDRLNYT